MKKITLLALALVAGVLLTSAWASSSKACDGKCCASASACAVCCGDAAGCAACCK